MQWKAFKQAILMIATALIALFMIISSGIGFAQAATPRTETPNPACGGAQGLNGDLLETCANKWTDGLTAAWSGYVGYAPTPQVVQYGPIGGPQTTVNVYCNGPSYAVFIPLTPGEYVGSVTLVSGVGQGVQHVNFDFIVGPQNQHAAPPVSCVAPPPYQGRVNKPVVGMASTPTGGGYWLAGTDGSVQSFGDAKFFGDLSTNTLNAPIVSLASSFDGKGYWLLGQDGGVFSFGDAGFYGSTGGIRLNKPVEAMASTPDGKGYWFVASDGGIFAFGDARFFGSMGGSPLNKPVVGMTTNPVTGGYWLVASDGGIFAFNTPFYGSTGNLTLVQPIVGMTSKFDGKGYWFVASDGGIFAFGDAGFYGSGV